MSRLEFLTTLILAAPLIASVVVQVARFSKNICQSVSVISSALILFALTFFWIFSNEPSTVVWPWFSIGSNQVNILFQFTPTTLMLAVVVAFISLLVTIYSTGYFVWDENQPRYLATLSLFTFSMIGLALSGNLLQIFFFWELVGVTSYLLITFYRYKPEAAAAGTKALIMNKIGDASFIIALTTIYSITGSLDISAIEHAIIPAGFDLLISATLAIAAMSKSAQVPFHSWLPDAMEGPTPISALIHSATMVAAGVYLLVRAWFLLTPGVLITISVVGALTAIAGGVNALRENDLKRILAWSTISQLGLMFMILGDQGFGSSFGHLLSHAIFKAGLFLCAGLLIASANSNSIEEILNTRKPWVISTSFLLLCSAMVGLPLTIGFLSKEYLVASITSTVFLILFLLISLLSVLYSARLLSAVLPGWSNDRNEMHQFKLSMVIPTGVLALLSLWAFYSPSPATILWLERMIKINPPSMQLMILTVSWLAVCMLIAWFLFKKNRIHSLLNWAPPLLRIDAAWQAILVRPILFFSQTTARIDTMIIDKGLHGISYAGFSIALLVRWFDRNVLDGSVHLTGWLTRAIGNLIRQFVAGKIQGYIWWTLITLTLLFLLSRY